MFKSIYNQKKKIKQLRAEVESQRKKRERVQENVQQHNTRDCGGGLIKTNNTKLYKKTTTNPQLHLSTYTNIQGK